jgi:hypothetical protein
VERHNKPEVEDKGCKELLLNPLLLPNPLLLLQKKILDYYSLQE